MRRRFIALVALAGALVALALPGSSSALLATASISLTASGPSPLNISVPAGSASVLITNTDTVTHTLSFANGFCSAELAPNASVSCGIPRYVDDYAYTVDGTVGASVTVTPEGRDVTLTAQRHGFSHGARVLLHGTLAIANLSPPAFYGPRMPVTVYALPKGHHLWYRLATVMSQPLAKPSLQAHSVWQLWVRPHGNTTYRVEATSQPETGQYWENAQSRMFGLYLRRR